MSSTSRQVRHCTSEWVPIVEGTKLTLANSPKTRWRACFLCSLTNRCNLSVSTAFNVNVVVSFLDSCVIVNRIFWLNIRIALPPWLLACSVGAPPRRLLMHGTKIRKRIDDSTRINNPHAVSLSLSFLDSMSCWRSTSYIIFAISLPFFRRFLSSGHDNRQSEVQSKWDKKLILGSLFKVINGRRARNHPRPSLSRFALILFLITQKMANKMIRPQAISPTRNPTKKLFKSIIKYSAGMDDNQTPLPMSLKRIPSPTSHHRWQHQYNL